LLCLQRTNKIWPFNKLHLTNNHRRKIMGLFDTIVGAIQSQSGGTTGAQGTSGNLLESVMGMINSPETGGLPGLVQKISAGGLGEQVASWVSTGENLPVSAEQIQAALSSSGLQDIAARFGINTSDVAGQLSNLLPQVVDKLTPDGKIPEGNIDLTHQAMAALSGLFGNKSA
jgi:uncharacterized protein YidB (DUF937 family)